MLLGDIINGKEKSHLVLVHGECFNPHLSISCFRRHFKLLEKAGSIGLWFSVQFIKLKLTCYLYATPLQIP